MDKFKKTFLPIVVFAKIDIRRLFRDKVAIFFTFLFPLIFLFVFGGIFGRDSDVSFSVALINKSESSVATDFIKELKKGDIVNVDKEIKILSVAKEKMNRGEIDATIMLPADFGTVKQGSQVPSGEATVLYAQNSAQAGQTLGSVLESVFAGINSQLVQTKTPFTVTTSSTAVKGMNQFDYVFSGLLGFAIMTLGIFGPTSVFPRLKQRGVLRRYHTTSLRVWQYFTGNVLSNIVVGFLSVATMFVVALTVFKLNMQGSYFDLAVIVALSTVVLFGIGLAVGGWAKNENQAAPLANLITFPMMFLSGSFFPRFLMPDWLQTISAFFPLTPVIDSARLIVTEGKTIMELGPQIGLLVVWAVVIYAIAFKVFRWE